MTETAIIMTEARFRAIVDAYGAAPSRWPAGERDAAVAFSLAHAAEVQQWLDEAAEADGWLDVLPQSERLTLEDSRSLHWRTMERLAEHMPVAEVIPLRPRLVPRPPLFVWATGAGIAACIAGALFGVSLSLNTLGDLRMQTVLEQAHVFDSDSLDSMDG